MSKAGREADMTRRRAILAELGALQLPWKDEKVEDEELSPRTRFMTNARNTTAKKGALGASLRRNPAYAASDGAPLLIHFDVFGTIMLTDAAQIEKVEEAVREGVAESFWGRTWKDGREHCWEWSRAPPQGDPPVSEVNELISYASYCRLVWKDKENQKLAIRTFSLANDENTKTEMWRTVANTLPMMLLTQEEQERCKEAGTGIKGSSIKMLRSVFVLVAALQRLGRPFAILFRAFNAHHTKFEQEWNAFCEMRHPLYAHLLQGIGPMDGTTPGVPDRRLRGLHTLYRDDEGPCLAINCITDGPDDATWDSWASKTPKPEVDIRHGRQFFKVHNIATVNGYQNVCIWMREHLAAQSTSFIKDDWAWWTFNNQQDISAKLLTVFTDARQIYFSASVSQDESMIDCRNNLGKVAKAEIVKQIICKVFALGGLWDNNYFIRKLDQYHNDTLLRALNVLEANGSRQNSRKPARNSRMSMSSCLSTTDVKATVGSSGPGDPEADYQQFMQKKAREERSLVELQVFQKNLRSTLQALKKGDIKAEDAEDVWLRALQVSEVPSLKLKAACALAAAYAGRGLSQGATSRGVTRLELADFQEEILRDKRLLLEDSTDSFELSQVCHHELRLTELADKIIDFLAKEALTMPPNARHPMKYILVDLHEWQVQQGDTQQGQALWELACSLPRLARDPRTWDGSFSWKFGEDSGTIPDDGLRIVRPPALLWNLDRMALRPRCGSASRCPCCDVRQVDPEASSLDPEIEAEVRKELDRNFNLAGSMIGFGSQPTEVEPMSLKSFRTAEAAATAIVFDRRFEVVIHDVTEDLEHEISEIKAVEEKPEDLLVAGDAVSPSEDSDFEDNTVDAASCVIEKQIYRLDRLGPLSR